MTDFKNILDKAKEFEKKIKDSQNKISLITAEGVSGGERVKITLNGDGEIVKLFIDPEIFKENKDMIEDLIIAAHTNARAAIKQKTSDEISKVTGGLGIPGIKWPF